MVSGPDLGFQIIVIVYKVTAYGLAGALLYSIYQQLRDKA